VSVQGRGLLALCAASIALLVTASSALAGITRYASATGATMDSDCTSPNPADPTNPPCSLRRAVETVAQTSDEVIVAPGSYNLGSPSLSIVKAINVHGQDGAARPQILSSSGSFGVGISIPGAVLRRVEIDYSGGLQALDVFGGMAEQVVVHSSGLYSCLVHYDTTLRDSVCLNTAGGIGVELQSLGATSSANLRNVTAIASGAGSYGIQVETNNNGDEQDAVAKNVIASGVAADVRADANAGGAVSTITMSNSNYATESEETPVGGTATVTDPGTGTNQTAVPIFTDPGTFFHQGAASPTIDAGAADGLLGTLDLDGEARTMGAAPDIGADEYYVAPPYTPPATSPPVTSTVPFDLAAAVRKCKKKFRKGTRARKKCIKKARARAGA
jgi:hypothetical protein